MAIYLRQVHVLRYSAECIIHLVEECHPNLKSSSLPSYSLISKFLLCYNSIYISVLSGVLINCIVFYLYFILYHYNSPVLSSFLPCVSINPF